MTKQQCPGAGVVARDDRGEDDLEQRATRAETLVHFSTSCSRRSGRGNRESSDVEFFDGQFKKTGAASGPVARKVLQFSSSDRISVERGSILPEPPFFSKRGRSRAVRHICDPFPRTREGCGCWVPDWRLRTCLTFRFRWCVWAG